MKGDKIDIQSATAFFEKTFADDPDQLEKGAAVIGKCATIGELLFTSFRKLSCVFRMDINYIQRSFEFCRRNQVSNYVSNRFEPSAFNNAVIEVPLH